MSAVEAPIRPKRPMPAVSGVSPPAAATSSFKRPAISRGVIATPQRVVYYGPGGVGKTTLAGLLSKIGKRALVVDLDNGSAGVDVARIRDVESWDDLRAVLRDNEMWSDFDVVVVDSATKAEELAVAWTVANVPNDKGSKVDRLESYGFGKGIGHVYDTFLPLLSDLDQHVRAGRDVVLVCHECVANVVNPMGSDFVRYEPRLQSPPSGKNSIRHRVKEWCDHLLFVGYDVFSEDGKAKGGGTRTIYPVEMATHWAKSRKLSRPIPYPSGSEQLWNQLFGVNQ